MKQLNILATSFDSALALCWQRLFSEGNNTVYSVALRCIRMSGDCVSMEYVFDVTPIKIDIYSGAI